MADTPDADAPATDAQPHLEQLAPSATRSTPPAATADDDALGDSGKKALETERKARRDAEAKLKELEPLAEEARKRADSEKSELTKAGEALQAERSARVAAEKALMRFEVAADKNVPPKLVGFLHGETKEEVEASADALLAEIGPNGDAKPSVPGRPVERMSSGKPSSSLDDEDPMALIAKARGQENTRR
jgi:hypothetical protein